MKYGNNSETLLMTILMIIIIIQTKNLKVLKLYKLTIIVAYVSISVN